ncbi:MAG: DUF1501 domain-containing protein [Ilumatobacteraceae bacterium]
MIDPDISSTDALRLLSTRDIDSAGIDRRRFLQLMGWGVGAGAMLGGLGEVVGADLLPGNLRDAFAATPIGAHDGILVLLGQFGGSDGLNIVVPHSNATYYQQHGSIAIPANQVLPINGQVGLHPDLVYLKALYDAGQVAIVQGVGYPDPDLSHFSSMAYWMTGKAGNGPQNSGWIGRWLDSLSGDDPFRAVTVGQGLPLHLIGANKRGIAIPQWGVGFGGDTDVHALRMYEAMRAYAGTSAGRGQWHDMMAQTMKGVIDVGQLVAPVFDATLPDNDLEKKLTVAARLINANLGIRVIDTGQDGFDNHSSEPADLSGLMLDFDHALQAFFAVLAPEYRSRVTIMTYSEFGRTSWSNDSSGTDHGTTNNHFIIGPSVRGGLYGQQPSLANLDRWDRMDFNVDFRSLYATVLDRWLGGGAATVLGGTYEQFDVFREPPGGVAPPPPPPSGGGGGTTTIIGNPTGFVPLSPVRILDTRGPVGGHPAAFGARETWSLPVRGVAGVPADAAAVVVNLTGAGASADTYLTAWRAGEGMPATSNVNVVANGAVPNLAVIGVGSNGAINLFNSVGSAHVLADLVGYFREGTADTTALTSLVPTRLMDTRDGNGGRSGAFDGGTEFDLQITGRGGVPGTCAAAVLNVTVVGATDDTFITVWPNGEGMPATSSVNARAGETAANLVIAKLGADGKLRIRNDRGAAHVLVDVAGYFTAGSGGRYLPVSPQRLVDTRSGIGAAKARVGATPLSVQIAGVNGLPASGIAAVQINLTAVAPSEDTYLTVYPSGAAKPNASNLNLRGGGVRANSVVARVGPDGKILVACGQGDSDVLVDVVGYFTA